MSGGERVFRRRGSTGGLSASHRAPNGNNFNDSFNGSLNNGIFNEIDISRNHG